MGMRLQADLPLSPRPRAPAGIDRRDVLSAEIVLTFCGGVELATRLAVAMAVRAARAVSLARSPPKAELDATSRCRTVATWIFPACRSRGKARPKNLTQSDPRPARRLKWKSKALAGGRDSWFAKRRIAAVLVSLLNGADYMY